MRRALLALAAGFAACLGSAGAAFAQGQVYDPVPPRGSAYVRLVNVLPGEVTARPDFLPQQRLGTQPAQRVMAFTTVENVANRQLRLEFQEGQRRGQATLRVEPGPLGAGFGSGGSSGVGRPDMGAGTRHARLERLALGLL